MKSSVRAYAITLIILFATFSYSIVKAFYYLFAGVDLSGATLFNLPQWIIPYAAIGLALILAAAVWPLIKVFESVPVHIISLAVGITAFVCFELLFERIPALSQEKLSDIYSAQALLCVTPVSKFYPGGVPKQFSPVIRLHFYIISIILVLIFTKVILDGFIAAEKSRRLGRAYFIRLFTGAFLLIVCIIGNATDFFRNGSRELPLISIVLTVLFFILQSTSAGLFAAGFFEDNLFIAPITSIITCVLVYTGEYFVLGGCFYKLGTGAFFTGFFQLEGTVNTSLSPADLAIILFSGLLSFIICVVFKPFKEADSSYKFGRDIKWR